MRHGEIEVANIGEGKIDIVFCRGNSYYSHTLTWAEAKVLSLLLSNKARETKPDAMELQETEVVIELNAKERAIYFKEKRKEKGGEEKT